MYLGEARRKPSSWLSNRVNLRSDRGSKLTTPLVLPVAAVRLQAAVEPILAAAVRSPAVS